jgi:flagellar motility protein MotE (MotC chaperone)
MISTEKKKKIDERCKALEKEFERRYKQKCEGKSALL